MDNGKLRKDTIEFLSILDGAHETLKGLHWHAERHAEHILTDDIDHSVLEYQDKIAESVMGIIDDKFGVGELKALVGDAKEIHDFLDELMSDVKEYRENVGDGHPAIINIVDDFLTDITKWKYLATFL